MSTDENLELLKFIETLEKEIVKPFSCKFDASISRDFFLTSDNYIYEELIAMFRKSMMDIEASKFENIRYYIEADKNMEGRYLQNCIEKGKEYQQSIKRYSMKFKALTFLDKILDSKKDQEEMYQKLIDSFKKDVEIKKSEQLTDTGFGSTVCMIPESGTFKVACEGVIIGETQYSTDENGNIVVRLKL